MVLVGATGQLIESQTYETDDNILLLPPETSDVFKVRFRDCFVLEDKVNGSWNWKTGVLELLEKFPDQTTEPVVFVRKREMFVVVATFEKFSVRHPRTKFVPEDMGKEVK